MEVEFVHGGGKGTALRQVLDRAEEIFIVSAFVTPAGLEQVREPVLECVRRGGTVTMLLGVDRSGIASPELVRDLGGMLRKTGQRLRVLLVVESGRTFLHAKIYAARKTGMAEVIVGSFNLTSKGLSSNHEFAVHVTGKPGQLFAALREFADGIPGRRVLEVGRVDELAAALGGGGDVSDAETLRKRREEVQRRLERILAALPTTASKTLASLHAADWLEQLVREGAFWSYQFDLEKLSVPSGLAELYDAGILARETTGEVGTARVKRPPVSASYPLVPERRQQAFSKVAKRIGNAMSRFGFETPFGHWVPDEFLATLHGQLQEIAASLPRGDDLERDIEAHILHHCEQIEMTVDKIIGEAARAGVQHPTKWRNVRDPDLRAIKERNSEVGSSDAEWAASADHAEALAAVRRRLLAVKSKLDAPLAIGKLRRIRPELLAVPVELDPRATRRVLECMVWAVAENRGSRVTRRAVEALKRRLTWGKETFATLQSLSEALLADDGAQEAERTFFSLFGAPPYWADSSTEGADVHEEDAE